MGLEEMEGCFGDSVGIITGASSLSERLVTRSMGNATSSIICRAELDRAV